MREQQWRKRLVDWATTRRQQGHDVALGYNFAIDRTTGEHVIARMDNGHLRAKD